MKRYLILTATLFLVIMGFAQTQRGYVKTLGRPEKKGEPLSEVTIRVKGEHNYVNSQSDGSFAIQMAGKKNGETYSLQSIQKNGYELNEADFIGRQFAFSEKVPLTIVMVSSAQLQADKQRIESNAYKTAEKNYKTKYDQLEKQLKANKITTEQYREQINDLQDKFERYQSMINGLAEHYAHTDYDFLNEKDREINICIENGDLERADSLIQLLFDPIGVLERNKEALTKLDMQIVQANDIITQANEELVAVLKQQEKDAEYLYQLYTIALARYDNEKAKFYIETRAALDPTNPEWQNQAGNYLYQYQGEYKLASIYFEKALACSLKKYGQNHDYTATVYSNIGLIHDMERDVDSAIIYHDKSIKIWKEIHGEHSFEITVGYNNIGTAYYKKGDYDKALDYFFQSLMIRDSLLGEFSVAVADSYNNMGATFDAQKDYERALKCYLKALEIRDSIQEANRPEKAVTYSNIGYVIGRLGNHTEAKVYLRKAIEIYQNALGENHPFIAAAYDNLGGEYISEGYADSAVICFTKALDMEKNIYGPVHLEVATTSINLATAYMRQKKYLSAADLYHSAATIRVELLGANSLDAANACFGAGNALAKKQNYPASFEAFHDAWLIYRLHPMNESSTITMQNLYTMFNVFMVLNPTSEMAESYDIFMSDIAFTITDLSESAKQKNGDTCFLLEYGNWDCESHESLFEVEKSYRNEQVQTLIIKNGRIKKIEERPSTDYKLELKFVGQEEKDNIISAYHKYTRKR